MHEIITASADRLVHYNVLIRRSKGVWSWPNGYLENALRLLRITSDYLDRSSSYEILYDRELVGFCSVVDGDDRPILDHLWIEPTHIGRGAGRFVISQLIAIFQASGTFAIDVWPDPPAEGFYTRLGFEATGDMLASRIVDGPAFKCFRLNLRHLSVGAENL